MGEGGGGAIIKKFFSFVFRVQTFYIEKKIRIRSKERKGDGGVGMGGGGVIAHSSKSSNSAPVAQVSLCPELPNCTSGYRGVVSAAIAPVLGIIVPRSGKSGCITPRSADRGDVIS